MTFDVIIIGAGPAGAVLAYGLAKQNIKTLLIEKAHLPRYKACGGGLPLKTANLLPFDASCTFEKYADRGILNFRGSPIFNRDLGSTFAWLIMRDRFDQFLVEKAVEAGAQLIEDNAFQSFEQADGSVKVITQKGVFNSSLLVGADGVNSLVAHQAGLLINREVGIGLEAEVEVPPQVLELQGTAATFDFGALPNGYGWIFPKKNHFSIGIFQASHARAPYMKQKLADFSETQPLLKEYKIIKTQGHLIPLGGKETILHNGRVILLGDAANLVDSWLGEGIYYAIKSALIATRIIPTALAHGSQHLENYTRTIHKQILRDLKQARLFASWIYRFPYFMSNLLRDSTILQDNIFNLIRGDENFTEAKNNIMLKLPIILAKYISKGVREL